MEKSIESIWEEGFLESDKLIVPKVNDLYNQKSKDIIAKLQGMFRLNLIIILVMALLFPFVHYLIDALWEGVATSALLIALVFYSNNQMSSLDVELDKNMNNYEYLRAFKKVIDTIMLKNVKIIRFIYPITFFVALKTIWSAGINEEVLTKLILRVYPETTFVAGIPVFLWVSGTILILLITYFSDMIYKWDVNVIYGRAFKRLDEIIEEMEELKA